ncbi:S1 RNA-binding domain-containing protein [Streptomyces sp. NPDC050264]|uniref:S1 RNA-binding domain-containing protein n=1 Tax=Streptomyces sp. NPDC050264 TaxID=3155038 RepID=UPI00342B45AE
MDNPESPSTFQPGDILKGTVSGIVDFGAYVKLGDTEGLIDRLEVSWDRKPDLPDLLRLGQEVTVQVLDTGVRHGAIRLSLRALTPDPLLEFAREKLEETVPARVSHVGPVGVLADVGSGLTGILLPRLPDSEADDPQRHLQVGDRVVVRVLSVNTQERRIGLRLSPVDTAETAPR